MTLGRAPADPFALIEWRRRIAELYSEVRVRSDLDPADARERFRQERDRLFADHPSTPLNENQRAAFTGLRYFPYRSEWRVVGRLEAAVGRSEIRVDLGAEGTSTLVRVGRVAFVGPLGEGGLDVFWVAGYGGGVFLPFGDRTNGDLTYGGGRYLFDTIKGADLGSTATEMVLDFNFAYHPSCAYDDRWVCPLAPPGNRLSFPVPAGEMSSV